MDFGKYADSSVGVKRQADVRFRSPGILRKNFGKEAVAAQLVKKSRRSKSTEPMPQSPDDTLICQANKDSVEDARPAKADCERWSMMAKNQENMSKAELISSYRLLMNEHLRLERFLSIMSKDHEVARNRLESDLLDAMMCIEDLKQALEIRMARRRKIDPREAEERRALIRQNKKLLNQLYESAKKIERLEVTKLEMKEQLELLDFQMMEIENQKNIIEEELRRRPVYLNNETQTEENSEVGTKAVSHLHGQLTAALSELANQKAETAAAVAKQRHLDGLVRELRRDNNEMREQLARVDDSENSLAESDKPLAVGARQLKLRVQELEEHVSILEAKLKSTEEDQVGKEFPLAASTKIFPVEVRLEDASKMPASGSVNENDLEAAMREANESPTTPGVHLPRIDDLLLQETIRTFQTLLAERDVELSQLRKHILAQKAATSDETLADLDFELPQLCESMVQTEITMSHAAQLAQLSTDLADGGLLLTRAQLLPLWTELCPTSSFTSLDDQPINVTQLGLINAARQLRRQVDSARLANLPSIVNETATIGTGASIGASKEEDIKAAEVDHLENQIKDLKVELNKWRLLATTKNQGQSELDADGIISFSSPSRLGLTSSDLVGDGSSGLAHRSPQYFDVQLQQLRHSGELELARAHLGVSERRRKELERRISDMADEMARTRAEARAAEASLSAARRTEAALRRRLLIAMDIHGDDASSGRHSIGVVLSSNMEHKDVMELQAMLVKLEATNAALTESAQVDRTHLHEQSMRLSQLEAENRALMDRVSTLQAAEASAQRGIIRLQTLYEDMLREYSESRSHEIGWRNRERTYATLRNCHDEEATSLANAARAHATDAANLQGQLCDLQAENATLRSALEVRREASAAESTTTLVGTCHSPACTEVRRLLNAFQERYTTTAEQLASTQSRLSEVEAWAGKAGEVDSTVGVYKHQAIGTSCVSALRAHLRDLVDYHENLHHYRDFETEAHRRLMISLCLLDRLERLLITQLRRSDAVVNQLRSETLRLQLAAIQTDPDAVKQSVEEDEVGRPRSSEKQGAIAAILQRENELRDLHQEIHRLQDELEVTKAHCEGQAIELSRLQSGRK